MKTLVFSLVRKSIKIYSGNVMIDPNKRTDIDNQDYSFIKFKGDDMSKTVVMKVMDLQDIGKSTDDIAWIAKIPEFFKNFDLIK